MIQQSLALFDTALVSYLLLATTTKKMLSKLVVGVVGLDGQEMILRIYLILFIQCETRPKV